MIINLAENPKSITTLGYDVCIAGAGAAGITLAIYLGRAGKKVALLEGGDEEYTDQSMDMYKGKSTGIEYWGLDTCRLRYLGGTTNHWSGRCKPLDDVDFSARDFFGLPGWPISRSELAVFEAEAKTVLDIQKDFSAPDIPNWHSDKFIPDRMAKSAPTRFGTKFYDELAKSEHITLFINANLTDIRLDKDLSNVTEFIIKNYERKDYRFTGKNFIIALGAVENARLLLNCDSQAKNGIGNHSDFVGRCFMEHFNVDLGAFAGNKKYLEAAGTTSFYTSSAFSLEHKIGNGNVSMSVSSDPEVSGGRSRAVKKFIRDSICEWQALSELSRKFVYFHCPGDGVIGTLIEQSPNKESRITLDKETDSLGLRRVNLALRMNELDKKTIRTIAIELAKDFASNDFGRVHLAPYILDTQLEIPNRQHCHHMGTTRMAASAEYGVVDKDCKVFGTANLYVGGSSVFATSGGTNPTFTVVELALRLAQHLA